MSNPLFGTLSWLGYRLTAAVPQTRWFDWLTNFTGLEVDRQEAPATSAVLTVLDDHRVLVDQADLRTFGSLDDLKAWLFLTVSDVMISRGAFTALHTAASSWPGTPCWFRARRGRASRRGPSRRLGAGWKSWAMIRSASIPGQESSRDCPAR